jgi:hypothetical protein
MAAANRKRSIIFERQLSGLSSLLCKLEDGQATYNSDVIGGTLYFCLLILHNACSADECMLNGGGRRQKLLDRQFAGQP